MLSLILASARTRIASSMSLIAAPQTSFMNSILTRAYKTHQGAAKRWRKVSGGGFKRKQCGRLHGNVGWSKARNLDHLNGTVKAKSKGNHIKKLKRMLPHHN